MSSAATRRWSCGTVHSPFGVRIGGDEPILASTSVARDGEGRSTSISNWNGKRICDMVNCSRALLASQPRSQTTNLGAWLTALSATVSQSGAAAHQDQCAAPGGALSPASNGGG